LQKPLVINENPQNIRRIISILSHIYKCRLSQILLAQNMAIKILNTKVFDYAFRGIASFY